MSTTLKINYLKILSLLGQQSVIKKSVFGYPYRISLGDTFSENPFYNPLSNVGEILATSAWVKDQQRPVIYDIGAHCGFISSQLAHILKRNSPVIYSFEPVAPTFSDLVQTVLTFGLENVIHPIAIALSSDTGIVKLNYSKTNSMLAQIIPSNSTSNRRSGEEVFFSIAMTADTFQSMTERPDVIKIDVEGWEVHVFKGAKALLSSSYETGICLEWNPEAIKLVGNTVDELADFLKGYRFFYINDYEGQLFEELAEINSMPELAHVCNVFAIPATSNRVEEWKKNYHFLKSYYKVVV